MSNPTEQQTQSVAYGVQGNELKLAIPLTLETVTLVNGEAVSTPSDFYPNEDYPVHVVLSNGTVQTVLEACMQGNVAIVTEPGDITEGKYAVTVICYDDLGKRRRFKKSSTVIIVDETAAAGLPVGVEFNSETHLLDAAVFMAVSGRDGRGIVDYEVQESHESGGYNIVTFIYSDGTTNEMRVRNGIDGNAVLRHEAIEPEEFERKREAGELSENTIYLVYEEEE